MWQMALMDMFKQNQAAKSGAQGGGGAQMPDLMQELNGILGMGGKQRPNPQDVWGQMGYSQPYNFGFSQGGGFAPSDAGPMENGGQYQNPWVSFNEKYMPSGSSVGGGGGKNNPWSATIPGQSSTKFY